MLDYLLPVLVRLPLSRELVVVLDEALAGLAAGRVEDTVLLVLPPLLPLYTLLVLRLVVGALLRVGSVGCTLVGAVGVLEGVTAGAGLLGLLGCTAGLVDEPLLAGVLTLGAVVAGFRSAGVLVAAGRVTAGLLPLTAPVAGAGLANSRVTRLPLEPSGLLPEGMVDPLLLRTADTLLFSACPS